MKARQNFSSIPILARATIMLVGLVWTSVAFCGDILEAVRHGNIEDVRTLLKADPDLVLSTDAHGNTPLHFATNVKIAELLLTNKAKIEAKNSFGATPLLIAADNEHNKEMVEFLLRNGADVNPVDSTAHTPLYWVVHGAGGQQDIAELLRKYGGLEANPKAKIPPTVIGAWGERINGALGDTLTITQDRVIWNRTDELNKGESIIKLADIDILSDTANGSGLSFTIKDKKKSADGAWIMTHDITVRIYSASDKIKVDCSGGTFSAFGNGAVSSGDTVAGMVGTRTDTHWYEKLKN